MSKEMKAEEPPEQTHPLYAIDRDRVDGLLAHDGEPGPDQLTTAGMLCSRYGGFPGSYDILADIEKCLRLWKLDHDALNARCRQIWSSGWQPGMSSTEEVGSGADAVDRNE
ncbi:MAG: DUF3288 family protein [Prochlorococcus sp.]|nr:DUF3288 family protein [Prochlorococcaceae cyanobacterium Fu_MAG_50]